MTAAVASTALATVISLGGVPAAKAAECENPDSLTFAIIPTEETVAELQLYKPVTDRMAKLTGKKIEFFMPTSYASVVEGSAQRLRGCGGARSLLVRNRQLQGRHNRSLCNLR